MPPRAAPRNLFSTIGIARSAAVGAAVGFRIAPTAPGSSVSPAPAALASTVPKIRSGSRGRQANVFSGGSRFDGRAAREAGIGLQLAGSVHHFHADGDYPA